MYGFRYFEVYRISINLPIKKIISSNLTYLLYLFQLPEKETQQNKRKKYCNREGEGEGRGRKRERERERGWLLGRLQCKAFSL